MPITRDDFSYTMEMDTTGVPDSDKEMALTEAGATILDSIKSYLDKQVTPVSGGEYKRGLTSKEYRTKKKSMGKPGIANLQLTGAMLNDLEVDASNSTITFKINDKLQRDKAYNHNAPQGSGAPLPQREFLPDDGKDGKFKPNVLKEAKEVINSFKSEEEETPLGKEFEGMFKGITIEQEDSLKEFLKGFL